MLGAVFDRIISPLDEIQVAVFLQNRFDGGPALFEVLTQHLFYQVQRELPKLLLRLQQIEVAAALEPVHELRVLGGVARVKQKSGVFTFSH